MKLVPYAWLDLFDARNLAHLGGARAAGPGRHLRWAYQLMRRIPEALFYRICYAMLAVVGIEAALGRDRRASGLEYSELALFAALK